MKNLRSMIVELESDQKWEVQIGLAVDDSGATSLSQAQELETNGSVMGVDLANNIYNEQLSFIFTYKKKLVKATKLGKEMISHDIQVMLRIQICSLVTSPLACYVNAPVSSCYHLNVRIQPVTAE